MYSKHLSHLQNSFFTQQCVHLEKMVAETALGLNESTLYDENNLAITRQAH